MQLVIYPDKRLSIICKQCDKKSKQDREKVAKEMWELMRKHHGIGLSAPQVGMDTRMFVWKQDRMNHAIWNPRLEEVSGSFKSTEGCLSLPGVLATVTRGKKSFLIGESSSGKEIRFMGDALMTSVWQHEIDHLDGILIIDRESEENKNKSKI